MRTFIKKSVFVKAAALSLLTLFSVLVITPGQAQAQGSVVVISPNPAQDSRCPTNAFCLFENTNFSGGRASFTGTLRNFSGHTYNNGIPLPNSASSMINNTGHTITMGHGPNTCGAPVYTARANSVDSTFTNNSFNDQANCLVFI